MSILSTSIRRGRPAVSSTPPSSSPLHFIYKSCPNVQFSLLLSTHTFLLSSLVAVWLLYSALHTAVHNKTAHLKVHYACARDAVALGWETKDYEFYGVAGAGDNECG